MRVDPEGLFACRHLPHPYGAIIGAVTTRSPSGLKSAKETSPYARSAPVTGGPPTGPPDPGRIILRGRHDIFLVRAELHGQDGFGMALQNGQLAELEGDMPTTQIRAVLSAEALARNRPLGL
jgi:hypothetical protein